MNVLFTICGRAGSKGIKNKNIRDFLGKPLPLYTLSAIRLVLDKCPEIIGDVVINTDSPELIGIMTGSSLLPVQVIERRAELGGDKIAKVDVILDCLKQMQDKNNKEYDMVVDLDITSPLRTVDDIINLIEKKKETGCDVAFSVTDSRRNPYFNMVKKTEKGYKKVLEADFVTRQEAPEMFDMNASIYAYKPAYLETGKGVLDGYCEVIKMYDTGILDLDHENDFELMEVIAKYLYEKYDRFAEIYKNIK